MNSYLQRREQAPAPPPQVDESYWASLLREEPSEPPASDESDYDYPAASSYEQPAQAHPAGADGTPLESDWDEIRRVADSDQVIGLAVVGYNRGGLLVEFRSLRGFVPASQLVEFPSTPNPIMRRKALVSRIGQTLNLRVIELNAQQNRLILSERAARALPGERSGILHRLRSGDTVSGTVTNLCDFGAFIDLGGLEGLIHISELSWGRVGHPQDILQRGQSVTVMVLDVNHHAGRIALSLKRLHPDPWATVHERYKIGQPVVGIVTNVVDFGAFARLEEGLEGLIHVSELAEGHFLHPRNVVREGQEIRARILSIDGQNRRLGLSLRGTT